jgi:protein-S-isoprenylcysteine O-methyltransferase Ste14
MATKRLNVKPLQKFIMLGASMSFIALLVVPALAFRLRGTTMPAVVSVIGNLLVAIGFSFIFLVYRENTFTSATIELAPDQKVISTGPYAIVRHPMYASASSYIIGPRSRSDRCGALFPSS